MDSQFWQQRWKEGSTTWHLPEVHGKPLPYLSRLRLVQGAPVVETATLLTARS